MICCEVSYDRCYKLSYVLSCRICIHSSFYCDLLSYDRSCLMFYCAGLASILLWFAVLWLKLSYVLRAGLASILLWHAVLWQLSHVLLCRTCIHSTVTCSLMTVVSCSIVQDLHPFYCDMQSYDSCLMFYCAGLASILLWLAVSALWQRSLQVVFGATEHSQTSHWQVSAFFHICW